MDVAHPVLWSPFPDMVGNSMALRWEWSVGLAFWSWNQCVCKWKRMWQLWQRTTRRTNIPFLFFRDKESRSYFSHCWSTAVTLEGERALCCQSAGGQWRTLGPFAHSFVYLFIHSLSHILWDLILCVNLARSQGAQIVGSNILGVSVRVFSDEMNI